MSDDDVKKLEEQRDALGRIQEKLEDVPPGISDYPQDVYFCDYCGKPFTALGDKVRHIASEHKSEPTPAGYPENLDA